MDNYLDLFLKKFATPLGIQICEMLKTQKWSHCRGYTISNADKTIEIWIANQAYGLRIEYGPMPNAGHFSPSWADRHLIWRAVKRLNFPSPRQYEKSKALSAVSSAMLCKDN